MLDRVVTGASCFRRTDSSYSAANAGAQAVEAVDPPTYPKPERVHEEATSRCGWSVSATARRKFIQGKHRKPHGNTCISKASSSRRDGGVSPPKPPHPFPSSRCSRRCSMNYHELLRHSQATGDSERMTVFCRRPSRAVHWSLGATKI